MQDFEIPKYLFAVVEEHRNQLKADNPARATLSGLDWQKTVCVFEITNTSKKKVNDITLTTDMGGGFCTIDNEADLRSFEKAIPIAVGDIQPGHSKKVRMWNLRGKDDFRYIDLKKSFHISANELDRVIYKYPIPGYLEARITVLPKWVGFWWSVFTNVSIPFIGVALVWWVYFKVFGGAR